MIRADNNAIIRPRKANHWFDNNVGNMNNENRLKNNQSVFKIRDKDFAMTVPGFYTNDFKGHKNQKDPTQSKKRKIYKTVLDQLDSYCDKTTLHGLRYVGDNTLTLGERVFWFVSFSIAIGFAAYYISNVYNKWKSSPVIISFSPTDVDIGTIPFPAITICNMNQAKKEEAEKILRTGTQEEKKLLNDFCSGNNSFDSTEATDWDILRAFLIKVGQSCSDTLKVCMWRSDKFNCDIAFNNDLTDEGLCCSFNRLPPEKIFRNAKELSVLNQSFPGEIYDWNPEKGFTQKDTGDIRVTPRRPLGAGSHLGLSLILDTQVDNYYCSSTKSIGFKVLLSNPMETPKMADYGFFLSPGMETRITIVPSIREATESLRDIGIDQRQCYFSNERPLQFYRSYSQRNCFLECQSTYTLRECACVPYFLPKNRTTKTCGKSDEICTNKAKEDMELIIGNGSSCRCLPGCFELSYTEKKSTTKLSTDLKFSDELAMNNDYFLKNIAVVHFYFQTTKFNKLVKSELYGFTEILSNAGGLLGLCMGFSFLSLVEIVYYFTLRLFCIYTKTAQKKKAILLISNNGNYDKNYNLDATATSINHFSGSKSFISNNATSSELNKVFQWQ